MEKLYAVIDVETTGGTPRDSRITDISIFLTDGKRVVDEFSTLVNPCQYIPAFITDLTGISNEMVANAPLFEDIAQRVHEITQGATFVAHNVNFDFGMVRGEFARIRHDYNRDKMCTVRLARQYFPGYKSYGLGKICGELDIPIYDRHRARGDAEATVSLFHKIFEMSDGELDAEDQAWIKMLPSNLSKEMIRRVPESAGIYYLYGQNGAVLHVGSAGNMFKKVVSHLKSKARKWKELMSQTTDLDFENIGSELIANIKLEDVWYKMNPEKYSIDLKKKWKFDVNADLFGYKNLRIVLAEKPTVEQVFGSKKEAEKQLKLLVKNHNLCARLSGIPQEECAFESDKNKCLVGPCNDKISAELYNQRIKAALGNNHQGNFVLIDPIDETENAFVVVRDYEYLGHGTYSSDDAIASPADLLEIMIPDDVTFEKSHLIYSFLGKNKGKLIKVSFSD